MKSLLKRVLLAQILVAVIGLASSPYSVQAQADNLKPIPVRQILDDIRQGTDVDYNNVRVQCGQGEALDFSLLGVSEKNIVSVPVAIKITNSVIECNVQRSRALKVQLIFSEAVDFSKTTFMGQVQLVGSTFGSTASFVSDTFEQAALFSQATFEQPADFTRAIFQRDAFFSAATFRAGVEFFSASFISENSSGLFFKETVFRRDTNFGSTTFIPKTLFIDASFDTVDFTKANFSNNVQFVDTSFSRKADFSGTTFASNLQVSNSTFDKPALFRNATFGGKADFTESSFDQFDLTGISIGSQQLGLFDTIFNRLIAHDFNFDWITLSDETHKPAYAVDVFAKLEVSFRGQGRQTLANEAFFNKRETECKLATTFSPSWIDCVLGQSVGHLVHLWDVIRFALINILVFSIVYIVLNAKRKETGTPDTIQNGRSEALLRRIGEAFILSVTTLVSLQSVQGESKSKWLIVRLILVPLAVNLEWVIGLFTLIALAATLANTIPLIGQLLAQLHP